MMSHSHKEVKLKQGHNSQRSYVYNGLCCDITLFLLSSPPFPFPNAYTQSLNLLHPKSPPNITKRPPLSCPWAPIPSPTHVPTKIPPPKLKNITHSIYEFPYMNEYWKWNANIFDAINSSENNIPMLKWSLVTLLLFAVPIHQVKSTTTGLLMSLISIFSSSLNGNFFLLHFTGKNSSTV